ncbi:site-specific integrase [Paenibacillus donghaensis]|nr:site-specific integrase [Paenibacillus donghaensis]
MYNISRLYSSSSATCVQDGPYFDQSSHRTLPLVPVFQELLQRIKPGYITQHYPLVLKLHEMRRIRFHDLRHSCASLLLANGVNMKDIQEWLGHSHYSTTANIYAHLDYSSKISSAQVMSNTLQIPIMQKAPESSQGQIQELVNC